MLSPPEELLQRDPIGLFAGCLGVAVQPGLQFGDEKVVCRVQSQPHRETQSGPGSESAIAGIASNAGARKGIDQSPRTDDPDFTMAGVGDVETTAINGNACRLAQ